MKRLKNILLNIEPNTNTYTEMYEGVINVFSVNNSYRDYDSTYYNGKIGFSITETDKLAKDKPTIVISIPYDMIGMTSLQTSNMKSASDYCLRTLAPYIMRTENTIYTIRVARCLHETRLILPSVRRKITNTAEETASICLKGTRFLLKCAFVYSCRFNSRKGT